MPLMMVTFLLLFLFQLSVMLHVSWGRFVYHTASLLDAARPLFLPLTLGALFLTLVGVIYDHSSHRLLQRGLQRRKTIFTQLLTAFTHRQQLERMIARDQQEATLDASELATSLRARVIGQDAICTDIAQQLRRRLALRNHDKPVGIFLFAGPSGNGKKHLAKQLARHMDRPLLTFDATDLASPYALSLLWGLPSIQGGTPNPGLLTQKIKENPTSIIVLDDIEQAHTAVMQKLLTAWNDGVLYDGATRDAVSIKRCIFILTSSLAAKNVVPDGQAPAREEGYTRHHATICLREAGFPADILNRVDRLFLFRPLRDLDMARVAALEIEKMIEGYGLHLAPGGVDPTPLYGVMRKNQTHHTITTVRDLLRFIEDMISDSLIAAQQRGDRRIALTFRDGHILVEGHTPNDARLGHASL